VRAPLAWTVRLRTVYGDPLEQAELLSRRGLTAARRDLDARARAALRTGTSFSLSRHPWVPVQAGGGVRDQAAAAALLNGGVARSWSDLGVEQPEPRSAG